jgi:very-short-patch-repair endonuclease
MSHRNALARLSSVTREQLGLFNRTQAHALGLSNNCLWRLHGALLVERLSPKVFRLTSSAPSWHQKVLAACLDGGPECVASHRTAAALHKFDGFGPGGVIEVLVPMNVRHRRREVIVHHTRALPDGDRTVVGVIPITSRARTLIDLGAVVPADDVEIAFDGAERASTHVRAEVTRRYTALRARGRNGIGAMTQIQQGRESIERIPRSILERHMKRLLERAGLPPMVSRYKLRTPDGTVYELDFAMVECTLDVEVDGHGSHATRRQRASDNIRANAIQDAHWTIRRFTYEQVINEPHHVAAVIRSAIEARRRATASGPVRHRNPERRAQRDARDSDGKAS